MDDKLIECQSRSALLGLSSGALVFCSLFFVQKRATKDLKSRSLPLIIGTSFILAGMSTYLVVKERMKDCEKMCNITRTDALAKYRNPEK